MKQINAQSNPELLKAAAAAGGSDKKTKRQRWLLVAGEEAVTLTFLIFAYFRVPERGFTLLVSAAMMLALGLSILLVNVLIWNTDKLASRLHNRPAAVAILAVLSTAVFFAAYTVLSVSCVLSARVVTLLRLSFLSAICLLLITSGIGWSRKRFAEWDELSDIDEDAPKPAARSGHGPEDGPSEP